MHHDNARHPHARPAPPRLAGGRRRGQSSPVKHTGWPRTAAWLVHLYTAGGAVVALLALAAAVAGDLRGAFLWLALAMFIDSTDGTFARRYRVKEVVPHFDGARLDDIVDYLAYTFVPIAIAHHNNVLPGGMAGLVTAAAPLLASCYGFCRTDAKTTDHFFTGFPSYWNVVVVYFFLLGTPPLVNGVILLGLSAMVFVPIRYAYPSRNPAGRRITFTLAPVWSVLVTYLILHLPATNPALAWASLFFPAYYIGLSLWLHFTTEPEPRRA